MHPLGPFYFINPFPKFLEFLRHKNLTTMKYANVTKIIKNLLQCSNVFYIPLLFHVNGSYSLEISFLPMQSNERRLPKSRNRKRYLNNCFQYNFKQHLSV
jgi:hypothetical protein